jgi:hypothetical protein
MFPQDSAGIEFVYKAHPAAHIEIRVGGCNAVDGPKEQQDVELFFAGPISNFDDSEKYIILFDFVVIFLHSVSISCNQ